MKSLMLLAATAAIASAFGAGEAAKSITAKRVRNERLAAAYANSCAQVKVFLKLDKDGETPTCRVEYLCPNCNEMHTRGAESYLREERPFEGACFAIAPDRFLMQDLRLRREWIARTEIEFGGQTYPAKAVTRYVHENAVELRTEKPIPGVKPLTFASRGDFRDDSDGVFFFSTKDKGLAVCGTKPNAAADFTHYADIGKDIAKTTGNALAINSSNEAVTVVFRDQLPLDDGEFRPPAEWKGEPIEELDRRWDAFVKSTCASCVPLYLHLDDEDNRKDGYSRRYSSYRSASDSTDVDLVGLVLPEGEVAAALELDASKMSEIDKIEVTLPSGAKAPLEFVGAFADQKLAVFRFADGKTPAGLTPLRLDREGPAAHFLKDAYAVSFRNFSGKIKSKAQPQTIREFRTGRGGEVQPDVGGANFGSENGELLTLFYADGSFGGMGVELRTGGRYSSDSEFLTAGKFARLLADRDFDPQFAIRKGKDRIRIAWIGVETQRMTDDLAREKKVAALLSSADSSGALVTRVWTNSPAAKAGLAVGDVLLTARLVQSNRPYPLVDDDSVDGFDWESFFGMIGGEEGEGESDFYYGSPWPNVEGGVNRTFTRFGIGKRVVVAYARDGERREATLTLEQAPVHHQTSKRVKSKDLGIIVSDMTFEVRGYFKFDAAAPGVVIVKVQPGNPAAIGGLRPLEIITHVNNEPVTSAKDFAHKVKGQRNLTFAVRRLAATRVVRIDLKERK